MAPEEKTALLDTLDFHQQIHGDPEWLICGDVFSDAPCAHDRVDIQTVRQLRSSL